MPARACGNDAVRIVQVHNEYSLPGGEDTISNAEAKLLTDAGHAVTQIRVRNAAGGAKAAVSLAGAAWNPRQHRQMRGRIRELAPDLVHVHNTWFTLSQSVIHALHSEGQPIVMTLQNYRLLCANGLLYRDGHICTECVAGSPWHAAAHNCYRGSKPQSGIAAFAMSVGSVTNVWRSVNRFLAPSQFVKTLFVDAGFAADRISVRPNFVADPGLRTARPSTSDRIYYVGRLSVEKGVDVLLEGWRRAGAAVAGLELVVVGDGPLRVELAGLEVPGVRFAGWLDPADLEAELLRARALVMPTQWYENFGRVIIESMAAGTPVLASDLGTPAEIVGAVGAEWLVDAASPDAWAEALGRLGDDRAIDDAGVIARMQYEQKYRADLGLDSLLAVYTDVLRGAVAPSVARGRGSTSPSGET